MEDILYDDKIVGRVRIRKSRKASRIAIRIKEGNIFLTIPQHQSEEEGVRFLQSKRDWIQSHLKKKGNIIFDENTDFQTITFGLKIEKSPLSLFHFKLTSNLLTILYPQKSDIYSAESQAIIRTGIERAMRMEAKRILPKRLAMLAEKYQFSFTNVTVRSSKTRWGSCSLKKSINLSYFLMTLPGELIDYVLLHELCHTREMNHGVRFWELLNLATNRQAKALQSKLKKHKTSF